MLNKTLAVLTMLGGWEKIDPDKINVEITIRLDNNKTSTLSYEEAVKNGLAPSWNSMNQGLHHLHLLENYRLDQLKQNQKIIEEKEIINDSNKPLVKKPNAIKLDNKPIIKIKGE